MVCMSYDAQLIKFREYLEKGINLGYPQEPTTLLQFVDYPYIPTSPGSVLHVPLPYHKLPLSLR